MLLGLVVHTCDPNSGEADTEDEFKVSLGCIEGLRITLAIYSVSGKAKRHPSCLLRAPTLLTNIWLP